jgi:hypothetical protein
MFWTNHRLLPAMCLVLVACAESPAQSYDATFIRNTDSRYKAPTRFVQVKPGVPGPEQREIAGLKKKIIELRNKGKLGFRKVVLCSSVTSYGVYSPVKPAQKLSRLHVYFEPANVSTLVTGDRYIIDCKIDIGVFGHDGKLIFAKKNIPLSRVSRSPVMDLYFKVGWRVTKTMKKGIVIKTVLHDRTKNESVTASFKLNVQSGKAPILKDI